MRERLGGMCSSCSSTTDLRRARDIEHFRLARQLGRTLVTLDRDYLDDRLFPPDGRRRRDRVLGAGRAVAPAPADPDGSRTVPDAGRARAAAGAAQGGVAHRCSAWVLISPNVPPAPSSSTSRRGARARGTGAEAVRQAPARPHSLDRRRRDLRRQHGEPRSPGISAVTRCTPGAAAMAAEAWIGAARGARHAVCLYIGDDVFAGLMLDGQPWSGAHGRAGAAAWLALNPVERQDYRKLGSLAAEVSAKGIARRLSWRIQAGDRSQGARASRRIARRDHRPARVRGRARGRRRRHLGRARHRQVHRHGGRDPRGGDRSGGRRRRRQRRGGRSDARAGPPGVRASAAARRDDRPARRVLDARSGRDRDRRRADRAGRAVRAPDDPALGRRPGAARPRARRRHARARRRSHRRHRQRRRAPAAATPCTSRFPDHYIVPGFIDVHVHGVEGTDTLDGGDGDHDDGGAAAAVRRHGVLSDVASPAIRRRCAGCSRASASARTTRPPGGARVLPAHLESNFINPDYKGAQPLECLRLPPKAASRRSGEAAKADAKAGAWTGDDILHEIAAARPDVGIVTVAPELDGALDLIRDLVAHGHHVSLGHSGATYEEAQAGIRAGARQATHLFNRMTPITHRAPGLAGAVLESRRRDRGAHLRRRARASGDDARRDRRQAPRAHHGDHRRHRRVRPAARHRTTSSAAARSPSATPRISTTARSPAAR